MARQKSIFPIVGTIQQATFYKSKGVYLVRERTSLNKEKILTDPNFIRVRENMQEMGGMGRVGRSMSLGTVGLKPIKDFKFRFRVGHLASQVKKLDLVSPRGERLFNFTAAGASGLGQHLELNENSVLTSRFLGVMTAVLNGSRNGVTLGINPFDATVAVVPGIGATHFRNFVAINSVSEYAFDAVQGYSANDGAADGVGNVFYGSYLSVNDTAVGGQAFGVSLPGGVVPAGTTGVFCWAGIEFYQFIGGVYNRLFLNDAGRVVLLG